MVRINGQTLREGQYISEGLKVEEIKPDGVILNYKNYRYTSDRNNKRITISRPIAKCYS